jgi:hypothetical protein
MNHAPFGTFTSRYGCGSADAETSRMAAAMGRRCTIGSLKTPRYTRVQAKPSGMVTVPVTMPSSPGRASGLADCSKATFPDARRNRPGETPTLAVKWLVNEPRLLYPTANEMSVTFMRVLSSMRLA